MAMENRTEYIIIGTLLNDTTLDNFFKAQSMLLREEMFTDRKNAFIYRLIKRMHDDGMEETTPYNLYMYVTKKDIKVGNTSNFLSYIMEMARKYYVYDDELDGYVKKLVVNFVKEHKKNVGQR